MFKRKKLCAPLVLFFFWGGGRYQTSALLQDLVLLKKIPHQIMLSDRSQSRFQRRAVFFLSRVWQCSICSDIDSVLHVKRLIVFFMCETDSVIYVKRLIVFFTLKRLVLLCMSRDSRVIYVKRHVLYVKRLIMFFMSRG